MRSKAIAAATSRLQRRPDAHSKHTGGGNMISVCAPISSLFLSLVYRHAYIHTRYVVGR